MRRGRRGAALPLVLFVLVVVAALVGGGFSLAFLEQRVGRNALYAVQAEGAAEAGAAAVLADWEGQGLSLLAPGGAVALPAASLPGWSGYEAAITRLNGELFLLRVEGTRRDADGGILARRQVELVLRAADSVVPGLPSVLPLPGRGWRYPPP
jgi:hypothetical protein